VEDAERVKAFKHPDLFGIDVNSKFETAAGVKDMSKVLQLKMAMK
jgi:phosphoribosylanthranilate isomerase